MYDVWAERVSLFAVSILVVTQSYRYLMTTTYIFLSCPKLSKMWLYPDLCYKKFQKNTVEGKSETATDITMMLSGGICINQNCEKWQ